MLPLSMTRTSALGMQRMEMRRAFARMRPANTSSGTSAERRGLVVWLGLLFSLAVAIGLGHVWLRLQVTRLAYDLSATREVISRLRQEERELTLEVATLEAPARVEAEALVRLGMMRPEKGQEAALP
jgi:cell division protein FtsL